MQQSDVRGVKLSLGHEVPLGLAWVASYYGIGGEAELLVGILVLINRQIAGTDLAGEV